MFKSFNYKFGKDMVTIFAGELYATDKSELIATLLGSCIAVCLYDKCNSVGGMCHFMLPRKKSELINDNPNKYGNNSIKNLVREMEKLGSRRDCIKAKIIGGGDILVEKSDSSIGKLNTDFARSYLKELNIEIEGEDVGKHQGRYITNISCSSVIYIRHLPIDYIEKTEAHILEVL